LPFFVVSWLAELVAPEGLELEAALELDGWSLEAEPPVVPPAEPPPEADELPLDGVLGEVLEPAPAEPLLMVAEPDIDVPPAPEGEDDGAALEDEDDEPGAVEGDAGALVEPEADDELVPEGAVVVPRDADVLSPRSHAARMLAPKATDTASARVESFMGPP